MIIKTFKTINICLVFIILLISYIFIYNFTNKNKKGLRICSWNVEWFGLPKHKDLFENIELPLYAQLINNIYDIKYYMNIINSDIICFQEVASTTTINVLTEYLTEYNLYSDTKVVSKYNQYNVFLVRKTIPVTLFKVLDKYHKMIRLDFKYNSEEISIYNIHLKADYDGDFSKIRSEQTKFLYEYIKQNNNKNVIITGDTNSQPGSNELQILEDNFINVIFSRKCNLDIEKKNSLWFDLDKNDLISKDEIYLIDYYLSSKNVYNMIDQMYIYNILYQKLFSEDTAKKISDHYPIILDLL